MEEVKRRKSNWSECQVVLNEQPDSHINICDVLESIVVHIFRQRRVSATKHKNFQTLVRYYIRQKTFNLRVGLEPVKRQVIAFFAIAFIPEDITTFQGPGAWRLKSKLTNILHSHRVRFDLLPF
jgi:hypothetical protein